MIEKSSSKGQIYVDANNFPLEDRMTMLYHALQIGLATSREVHVKRDYSGSEFFGLPVIKGYYCGTAPEMTPMPTDVFWMAPPIHKQPKVQFIVMIVMLVIITCTFIISSIFINDENNASKYFLLEDPSV